MSWEGQIKAVGISAIVVGVLTLLYLVSEFAQSSLSSLPGGMGFILMGVLMVPIIIPFIACGIGLIKHKNWARIVLIVISILGLISVPNTFIGIKLKQSLGVSLGFIDYVPFIFAVFLIWFLIVLFNKNVKALMMPNSGY
ncbi:MAG: hypothetical protein IH845_01160 [Nanoarchaeota archaeon]|nr:hypothetical protein [Nanoarchaeota archaeon]